MVPDPLPTLHLDGVETSIQRKGLAARIGRAALFALLLPFVAMIVGHAHVPGPVRILLGLTSAISPALAMIALAVRVFRWKRPGSVVVSEDHLVLERSGHDQSIPLDQLVEGHVSPLRRSASLALANGDVVHVFTSAVEDAQRLLVATGLDASRRAMRLRLGETFFLDFLVLVLGPGFFTSAVAWAGAFGFLISIALTAALFFAVRAFLGPAELVVGADGIIVRQNFSSTFIPFNRIESIDPGPPDHAGRRVPPGAPFVLRLTDGSEVRARTRHLMGDPRAELLARIADARRAWEAGGASGPALAQLDRNGRSMGAWRAAMRALLATPEDYRAQAITRDALVEVLESPAAPAERRVAAALALAGSDNADARPRIRIAAQACADTGLREALEHAADDALDDETIEHMLERR
jgi:hypothetical protein